MNLKAAKFNVRELESGWVVVHVGSGQIVQSHGDSEWGARGAACKLTNEAREAFLEATGMEWFKGQACNWEVKAA